MANLAGVPYGRLSFNLAITILHMRANTNLLCSKQLSLGDSSMSIWEKLAGAATGMVRSGPIGAFLGGSQEQDGPG